MYSSAIPGECLDLLDNVSPHPAAVPKLSWLIANCRLLQRGEIQCNQGIKSDEKIQQSFAKASKTPEDGAHSERGFEEPTFVGIGATVSGKKGQEHTKAESNQQ